MSMFFCSNSTILFEICKMAGNSNKLIRQEVSPSSIVFSLCRLTISRVCRNVKWWQDSPGDMLYLPSYISHHLILQVTPQFLFIIKGTALNKIVEQEAILDIHKDCSLRPFVPTWRSVLWNWNRECLLLKLVSSFFVDFVTKWKFLNLQATKT